MEMDANLKNVYFPYIIPNMSTLPKTNMDTQNDGLESRKGKSL